MSADDPVSGNESRDRAINHAWDWWKYHADQRIALIRFYILTLGGIAAAIGWLHQQHQILFSVLLSAFGAILTFCFLRLDTRTADLVKIGEDALRNEELWLSSITSNEQMKLCQASDNQKRYWPYTYGQVISTILSIVMTLFLATAVIIASR